MIDKLLRPAGFERLGLLLMLACVALIFQLIPSVIWPIAQALDSRNWSRGGWIALNLGVVLILFAVRFGPELFQRSRTRRTSPSLESENHLKRLTMKEERQLYERMREARKRQVV